MWDPHRVIGSVWLRRTQRLRELELEAIGAQLALARATSARKEIEKAIAQNKRELERCPETLQETQVSLAAAETNRLEAEQASEHASRLAQNAQVICSALRSVTSQIGSAAFETSAMTMATQIRWQIPPDDEFGCAAIAALQATANGETESFGRLCEETSRSDGRLWDLTLAARDAAESLNRAERNSYEAQRQLAALDGRSDSLIGKIEDLSPQLGAALEKEAEAREPYNSIIDDLQRLRQEHADAESEDRCEAARDDATFTVIRVIAEVLADADFEEPSGASEGRLEEETGTASSTVENYLIGLGAIPSNASSVDGASASYFLVIRDRWHPSTRDGPQIDFGTYRSSLIDPDNAVIECVGTIISASDAFIEILSEQSKSGGDKSPADGESRQDWLQRVAVTADKIDEALDDLASVGGDIACASMFRDGDAAQPVQYAVGGMIPYGCVSEFAASGGTGKSHLAIELIAAFCARIASGGARLQVLGAPVNLHGGRAAYIYAEDPESEVLTRLCALQKVWPGRRPLLIPAHGRDELVRAFNTLRSLPPHSLIIVDPGGKYLDGPDTDTNAVNRLFALLESFAAAKQAAVIVMHHQTKGALTRASSGRQSVKGATAWVDNPRVVYVMTPKSPDAVDVVLEKGNLSGLRWRSGAGALFQKVDGRLLPLGARTNTTDPMRADQVERVCVAIKGTNERGILVQKSGRRGLYALKVADILDLTRRQIEDAIDVLIAQRRITKGPKGLIASEHPLAA